jgi:CheY-like chemotaxis protein
MTVPVLVVDDNPGFLRVVRSVFARSTSPFALHTVETGQAALAFLERRPPFADAPRPAFVVLDFRLPDTNAPALLEQLSTQEDLRDIPVLVLSQAGWEQDAAAAEEAGATVFRVKPSGVRALRDLVIGFWKEHAHGGVDSADRG